MARPLHPPDGTRFFARLSAASLECPRCGTVHTIGPGGHHQKAYNKRTARFTCTDCSKVFILGILAWPVPLGGTRGQKGATLPRDQVPNERQLAELRGMFGGVWLPDGLRPKRWRPDDSNMTAGCSCKWGYGERSNAWEIIVHDPHCPLHQGEED